MDKLIGLIKQHTELFTDSIARRMQTSSSNKERHAMVLEAKKVQIRSDT